MVMMYMNETHLGQIHTMAFLMRQMDQILFYKYIYGADGIFYWPQEVKYDLTNTYMVLMTFLMADQLCAGLHPHLLTALSQHLLILVPAIIVIATIVINIIVIAIIIIAIDHITFVTIAIFIITFIIIAINSIILIINIFVTVTG